LQEVIDETFRMPRTVNDSLRTKTVEECYAGMSGMNPHEYLAATNHGANRGEVVDYGRTGRSDGVQFL